MSGRLPPSFSILANIPRALLKPSCVGFESTIPPFNSTSIFEIIDKFSIFKFTINGNKVAFRKFSRSIPS